MADSADDIELVCTCEGCPEQYDAVLDGATIGYLRLRHGRFTVQAGGSAGPELHVARPRGDGVFEPDEREGHLRTAREVLWRHVRGLPADDPEDGDDGTDDLDAVTLVQTSVGCPEQYDAVLDGVHIGYLRLRHGRFTVQAGGPWGPELYSAEPRGDGVFEPDERERYLTIARKVLLRHHRPA